ncbi:MAG TPA: MFS transporter [Acetobacteraceae bacterium]|jgi:MFS family permease|nr:MFS transporter [Acetobacteraceae bacterium]
MASLSAIGGVLAQRNARIFYSGSIVCWTGSWVQRIATDWLAWELTHSALWVSIIAFCNLAPSVIISPIAGAVADRMDRVRLTMVSQFISVAQAVILVTLITSGHIRVEFMAFLTLCNGAAETFAQPARQCLIPGLVPRSHLPGAVALNSLTYNAARFVGPAISGPMIAVWGVVPSIVVNALAFLYASLTMYLLRLDPSVRRGKPSGFSVLHDAFDGIKYVARHRGIGPLMLFAATVGMTLRSVPEMLPPYVADQFGRGAEGLATLASTMGCAALIGGLFVAVRGRMTGLTRIAVGCGLILAIATAGFVATPIFAVGVACMAAIGAATTMHGISCQTLLQNAAAPGMIGRVLSTWGMITRAAPAMGALTYGVASEFLGLRIPVLIGVLVCMAVWLITWRRLSHMVPILEGGGSGL